MESWTISKLASISREVFFELDEFLRLFVRFAREYGLVRVFLRGLVMITMVVLMPRHETLIRLKNGCELFVIPNDIGISAELRAFKTHEPLATRSLMKKLRKGMVVVDIGSNIGYYAILESKLVGHNGIVVAVEPDPVNFSYLLRNARLNKLSNMVTVNKAVSDKDGPVRIMRSNRSNWSRILRDNQNSASRDMIATLQTEAVTLDTLIDQLGLEKIDLIRMDVEGHEDHIIRASQKTMRKYLPDILMEIHLFIIGRTRSIDLLNALNAMGYRSEYVIPRNVDFPLVYRNDDVSVRNIASLVQALPSDVFSVYSTTHPTRCESDTTSSMSLHGSTETEQV